MSLKVFLVDDGSTDGTAKIVSRLFPSVRIIHGNGKLYWNQGMRVAWNTAVAEGKWDAYLWLNDDVMLYSDSIYRLVEFYESLVDLSSDRRQIVVGTCIDTDKELPSYGGRDSNAQIVYSPSTAKICHVFNGNFVLVPREVFSDLGNLSPIYQHGFGDYDYGLRARSAGVSSVVMPGYIGECKHHEDAGWSSRKNSFLERWKIFHSPTGLSPRDYFLFQYKRHGIMAVKFLVTSYIRMVFGIKLVNLRKNMVNYKDRLNYLK